MNVYILYAWYHIYYLLYWFDELMYVFINVYIGGDDEICPYATFHLLGFREEMDPQQAGNNFQTFPHQNGHGSQQHFVNSPASRSMVGDQSSLTAWSYPWIILKVEQFLT